MPSQSALSFAEQGRFSQIRAFSGDVLYTEGMPALHLYIVKEGEVDLYLVREEKRTVVDTVRRGQCFGVEPHLAERLRVHCAAARSYCELYVVDVPAVQAAIGASPDLVRGMLETQSERLAAAHEVIAQRVNFQPELLAYAQLLQLAGQAEIGRRAPDAGARPGGRGAGTAGPEIARPLLQDVVNHARVLFGHSDRHIRGCLGRLLSLHLVRLEDERGNGKELVYAPRDIVGQVRKAVASNTSGERQTHQYLSLEEFGVLVDVEPGVLLRKLAAGDFAQDIFTFRRDEILRVLDTKGRRYFAERKIKPPAEFSDVEDIEFADTRSIFDAVSRMDSFDLAKVLHALGDGAAKAKVLAALSARRRSDVEADLQGLANVDPVEARRLGDGLIAQVKALMLEKAG